MATACSQRGAPSSTSVLADVNTQPIKQNVSKLKEEVKTLRIEVDRLGKPGDD